MNNTKLPRWYSRRVRLNSAGYDSSGSYYGAGAPLYWCYESTGAEDFYIRGTKAHATAACNFVRRLEPAKREIAIHRITTTGRWS